MNAAEVDESDLHGKFRELQTKCRAVHTESLAGFSDVGRIANRSIALE